MKNSQNMFVPSRRDLLVDAGASALALAAGALPARAQAPEADYHLTIAPISLEIAPGHVIETIGYNGTVPGPLLRLREGRPATIAVTNTSPNHELVHWHGLAIPSNVDGAMEEGTPMLMPGRSASYTFTPRPAGNRWYHSHAMAGKDLTQSLYSGQFGFLYVEPSSDPGRYDQEMFIAMHQWEPSFVSMQDIRKGPPPDNGLEVAYKSASFNGKAFGHGEPVRVRQGQRVLFRLLNASATDDVMVALAGHRFTVIAMDGNAVPSPQTVSTLMLAPAERIDAIVEMNNPGIWVFGSTKDQERQSGMGIVVEYADAAGAPAWDMPPMTKWDYLIFGSQSSASAPDHDRTFHLLTQKIPGGRGGFNRWTINGKSWPDSDPIVVEKGKRYRLVFQNDSGDMHPMHLHRHLFEIVRFAGKSTSGIIKDVVNVPGRQTVEVDFVADNPGPSLLHCHMQEHQDFGFMALVRYA
ncbi:MAG: multicopper oxidase, type 3 [Hyphomicrobiales bacterium]|nr:multicopper oxidase, type 3 [Hyphomicrobiales bacterium]